MKDPLNLYSIIPPAPPEVLAEEALNILLFLEKYPNAVLVDRDGHRWHKQPKEMNGADALEYLEHRWGPLFARLIKESGHFRTH